MKYFNVIIFIKAKRTKVERFKLKRGNKKLFELLDSKQMEDNKKIKFCDYVVVNEKIKYFEKITGYNSEL